jgi:MFS family permease
MQTASGAQSDTASASASLPRRSVWQLISISIFWFALNFHWAALPAFIVPPQVVGLLYRAAPLTGPVSRVDWVNTYKPLAVAIVLAPGLIVALIANPFFGLLSDRTPGRFGRRRPYILGGTLANVVSLGIMAFLPSMLIQDGSGQVLSPSLLALMAGLMLTQLANNAAAAPFHALLPDLVPPQQRGTASGIIGVAYWLGTVGGSLLPFVFGLNFSQLLDGTVSFGGLQQQIVLAYATLGGIILLMAILTALFVHETPWRPEQLSAAQRAEEAHTSRDLLLTILAVLVVAGAGAGLLAFLGRLQDVPSFSVLQVVVLIIAGIGSSIAFNFRPRRNPDFTWVVVTRLLVTMGVYIVFTFLQFYMADVAHADPGKSTAEFLIIVTVAATLSTAAAGWASDRVGRKRMVYFCGALMILVGAAFVFAPYLVPGNILTLLFGAGALFGLGFGAYISVDWALVADVLPSEETFARDMGIWNIGLTVAQVLAAVVGGWLLTVGILFGSRDLGYTLLFVGFVISTLLGTVTVRYIKGVK